MSIQISVFIACGVLMLTGCANNSPLGDSVASVRFEQTYDQEATLRNIGVVPSGTGARMQVGYDAYVDQSAYDSKPEQVLGAQMIQTAF